MLLGELNEYEICERCMSTWQTVGLSYIFSLFVAATSGQKPMNFMLQETALRF